MYIFIYR